MSALELFGSLGCLMFRVWVCGVGVLGSSDLGTGDSRAFSG